MHSNIMDFYNNSFKIYMK